MNGGFCFSFYAGKRLGLATNSLHILSCEYQVRMALMRFGGSKIEPVILDFIEWVFAMLNELTTQLGSRFVIARDVVFYCAYCESPFPVHGGLFATDNLLKHSIRLVSSFILVLRCQ